jgi:hypothetical protein
MTVGKLKRLTQAETDKAVADGLARLERTETFFYEIGNVAWMWNMIELILDNSIAYISGVEPTTLEVMMPETNIQRKFQIFQQLLKVKKYSKKIRSEAAKEVEELKKLLKRRNAIVHGRWLAVVINAKDEVEAWDYGRNMKGKLATTNINKLKTLAKDLNKSHTKFVKFLHANGLYSSQ